MNTKEAIIAVVNRIPRGRVASYGQIAQVVTAMLDKRISAQLIGRQLSGMDESERGQLPRRRVVNRKGEITSLKLGEKGRIQKLLLEDDGILVYQYQVPMERYRVEQEVISF